MAGLETLRLPLPQSQQPAGQRRGAVEPDQRFGADQVAGRAEQRMPTLAAAQQHALHILDRTLDHPRVNELKTRSIGADAPVA